MRVLTFTVFFVLAIYQVASAPAQGRKEYDGTYKRQYLPYIQSETADGKKTILTDQDLLNLNTKLESGDVPPTTLFKIFGINDWEFTLSDHQLRKMAKHEVAAIVNPQNLNKPGFGHLFLTIDDKGVVQTFVYNLSLQEANQKVAKEGFPNSSSSDSYHKNPPSTPNVVKKE